MLVKRILERAAEVLEQRLPALVEKLGAGSVTPRSFRGFMGELKSALDEVGRAVFVDALSACDLSEDRIAEDGKVYVFKKVSPKQWLTIFGEVTMDRNYFQQVHGDIGRIPLDERTGMLERYLTPDLEEQVSMAAARMAPAHVHELFAKIYTQAPSVKAIQRVIEDVGGFAAQNDDRIQAEIEQHAPLSTAGNILVSSIDGVLVPMREKTNKPDHAPEPPGLRDSDESKTAWREAGVATLSIYSPPTEDHPEPLRVDSLVFGRMPEPKMKGLFSQQCDLLAKLVAARDFAEVVFLCDGKPLLWNTANQDPVLRHATQVLDFYHATGQLSRAADALFGKVSIPRKRWYDSHRATLLVEELGVEQTIRSMRYHRRKLRKGSERHKVVTRVMRFFARNRKRMRYLEFLRRGLPIGSGPVEAACKTLVGARLKQSGMRWSRDGAQKILSLRAYLLSNRWDTFWNTYQQRHAAKAG